MRDIRITVCFTSEVNPGGKLAITFPSSDADLPHPTLLKPPVESDLNHAMATAGTIIDYFGVMAKGLPAFQSYYGEKLEVGYKWYDARKKAVLFPFGYGLSYTSYAYSDLTVKSGDELAISFTVMNTGPVAGTEIAEIYASLPDAALEPPKRLIGWALVDLRPGESKEVSVPVKLDRLKIFDAESNNWKLVPGSYAVMVGGSSQGFPLHQEVTLR